MLVSTINLANSIKKFEENRENFDDTTSTRDMCVSCIIIALILMVIELAVLYFALVIAWNVSDSNVEKFLHVVLALTITLPYLLLNLLFNQRAKQALMM